MYLTEDDANLAGSRGELKDLFESEHIVLQDLEQAFETLSAQYVQIDTRGMSKQNAVALESLLPTGLFEQTSRYTTAPSLTQKTLACEGILTIALAVIAAALVAVGVLIVKLYKWIKNKTQEGAEAVEKAAEDIAAALNETDADEATEEHAKKAPSNLRQFFESRVRTAEESVIKEQKHHVSEFALRFVTDPQISNRLDNLHIEMRKLLQGVAAQALELAVFVKKADSTETGKLELSDEDTLRANCVAFLAEQEQLQQQIGKQAIWFSGGAYKGYVKGHVGLIDIFAAFLPDHNPLAQFSKETVALTTQTTTTLFAEATKAFEHTAAIVAGGPTYLESLKVNELLGYLNGGVGGQQVKTGRHNAYNYPITKDGVVSTPELIRQIVRELQQSLGAFAHFERFNYELVRRVFKTFETARKLRSDIRDRIFSDPVDESNPEEYENFLKEVKARYREALAKQDDELKRTKERYLKLIERGKDAGSRLDEAEFNRLNEKLQEFLKPLGR